MKKRHEGPIPEGKQRCPRCEGWGVTHYPAADTSEPVICTECDGEGITSVPVHELPEYKTIEDEFYEWLATQNISPHSLEAHWAEIAWNAAAERYGDGY